MLRAVWHHNGLGRVQKVIQATGGARNECYIVNDELVVRFNTLDPQFAKFRNEQAAYQHLTGTDLPVPRVVLLDESRSIVPYDLIALTRLRGVNMAESWERLDAGNRNELVRNAGRSLAELHARSFNGFGKLAALETQPFASWRDYFTDYAQRYIQRALRHKIVSPVLVTRLQSILDGAGDLLSSVTRGVLVHSDFHYENILQENGKLSGILDFEWALSGDSTYDFIAADVRNQMIPGSEAVFVEGYLSVRRFDEEHERRLALYRLFFHLEDAVMGMDVNDRQSARSALESLSGLLPVLEAGPG